MPKLIIQIPCFNEEEALPQTLPCLPRSFSEYPNLTVEWLIIDDGSSDRTIAVAKQLNVDHILPLRRHLGLAKAWSAGIQYCLQQGADYIINFDADNQYEALDMIHLLRPLIEGKSDMTIGCRNFDEIPYFSPLKRKLQKLGSWGVSKLAQCEIRDATSGYRGYTAASASLLNVFSRYTYTLETILQAGKMELAVSNVYIRTNPVQMRPSRLLKSTFGYIRKSIITIARIVLLYNPMKFFLGVSILFFIPALLIGIRFLYYYLLSGGHGMIQSLILGSVFALCAVNCVALGIIAELSSVQRRMLEQVYARVKKSPLP